ncbi:hypothetical protein FSP39_002499 [Pinctada imbricata]|uniref:Thymidylate kinase-like domain-containing protein n=1 Tax=Pinctada imbricata TaxID=66713 RepID=A0AA88YWT3_PINIB|nr:hypothetical protein FSP39_002499 [Pinctada imbricata]
MDSKRRTGNKTPTPHAKKHKEDMDSKRHIGKTTLTETLEKKLGAARYYTPPHHIAHLRKYFDSLPELVRRAYYCLGNYIVAVEISKECRDRPVIMDRFWHSTTAYGITNESSDSDLPPPGHRVYRWPSDLVQPTLILFLTVSEEIRKQRIQNRGGEKTHEEKVMEKDQLFRKRLCEAYRRMHDPAPIELDSSGSVESVVKNAVLILQQYHIQLDRAP